MKKTSIISKIMITAMFGVMISIIDPIVRGWSDVCRYFSQSWNWEYVVVIFTFFLVAMFVEFLVYAIVRAVAPKVKTDIFAYVILMTLVIGILLSFAIAFISAIVEELPNIVRWVIKPNWSKSIWIATIVLGIIWIVGGLIITRIVSSLYSSEEDDEEENYSEDSKYPVSGYLRPTNSIYIPNRQPAANHSRGLYDYEREGKHSVVQTVQNDVVTEVVTSEFSDTEESTGEEGATVEKSEHE